MDSTTPPSLSRLSETLLHTLGRHSRQDNLLEVLRECGLDDPGLLRQGPVHPYPVVWPGQGLTVLMQYIKPNADAAPQEPTWGVQSITLEAGHWPGPWPKDFDPDTVTPDALVDLLAQDKEQTFCTPEMACLSTAGPQEQSWAVVALFEPVGGKLQNLTLARHGDWVAAPAPAAPVAGPAAQVEEPPIASPVTCFSGGTVGKTGWYEGLLPDDHPGRALYSGIDARFVYREAGQRMTTLGVKPSRDETLVIWIWRGEQRPQ
jgi:hypothetical protein